MEHNLQPLLTFCEENFTCQTGEPKAYMEFPHPDRPDENVRVVYVVYAISAKSFKAAESWMIDNVLMPLTKEAGQNPRLYWRKKFAVTQFDDGLGRLILRVRLAVLTQDYEPVEIVNMIKPEEDRYPILDPRFDEGGVFYGL